MSDCNNDCENCKIEDFCGYSVDTLGYAEFSRVVEEHDTQVKTEAIEELEQKLRVWDNKANAIPEYVWHCINMVKEKKNDIITWQRDMKIAYESGREERTAEIIKAIEEIRDCGFWCMHDLCREEPTAYNCEKCALDYVIKRIKEQKNGSIET